MICKQCLGWMILHPELVGWRRCLSCSYSQKEKNSMITMEELLSNQCKFDECDESQQENLKILLDKINQIRTKWGKPMTVTSGLRTMKHHLEIYAAKGVTDPAKIPMQSKHLYGQAVDIADLDGSLKKWVDSNVSLLEDAGLWCEAFSSTPTWVHFQIIPPKSGNRFFIP